MTSTTDVICVGGYVFCTSEIMRIASAVYADCNRAINSVLDDLNASGTYDEARLRLALSIGFGAAGVNLAVAFGPEHYQRETSDRACTKISSIIVGIAEIATIHNPTCQE